MTPASLKSYSQKDLAQMARQGGVRGWHAMRKDQLIKALLTAARIRAVKIQTSKKVATPARRSTTAKRAAGAAIARGRMANEGVAEQSCSGCDGQ